MSVRGLECLPPGLRPTRHASELSCQPQGPRFFTDLRSRSQDTKSINEDSHARTVVRRAGGGLSGGPGHGRVLGGPLWGE